MPFPNKIADLQPVCLHFATTTVILQTFYYRSTTNLYNRPNTTTLPPSQLYNYFTSILLLY